MTVRKKKSQDLGVQKKMKHVPRWTLSPKGDGMSQVFKVANFLDGLALVARIAVHAEVMGHHPDIELSYNTVKVTLTTHDKKVLTNLDFELAKRIDTVRSN